MNLNNRVTSTIQVTAPNCLEMQPGGAYNLNEKNELEMKVVQLHLLQHHISLMIEDLCESNENRIHFGKETENLATALFAVYAPSIKFGIDVFNTEEPYYEAGTEPFTKRLRDVRAALQEALELSCCAVECGYLRSLITLVNNVALKEYRETFAMLVDYERDYNTTLYWKKYCQL